MPEKSCFVIMPFGGGNVETARHFAGVYQSIVVPAVHKAGYTPKRADTLSPGNIMHAIVEELVRADVAIADLTAMNFNVAYELGVRHSFRKAGTIHIVDKTHAVPFDVRQYRVISYSTNLADIPDTIDQIAEAIEKRALFRDRSDNPIHDAISEMPPLGDVDHRHATGGSRVLAAGEPKFDVFLSYSVADRETALDIATRLGTQGVSHFMAEKSIGPGQLWELEIRDALLSCRQFWLLVTPNSLGSDWVLSEWAAAWVLDKTIVPVILRCRPDELPKRLQAYQCLDFHRIDVAVAAIRDARSR